MGRVIRFNFENPDSFLNAVDNIILQNSEDLTKSYLKAVELSKDAKEKLRKEGFTASEDVGYFLMKQVNLIDYRFGLFYSEMRYSYKERLEDLSKDIISVLERTMFIYLPYETLEEKSFAFYKFSKSKALLLSEERNYIYRFVKFVDNENVCEEVKSVIKDKNKKEYIYLYYPLFMIRFKEKLALLPKVLSMLPEFILENVLYFSSTYDSRQETALGRLFFGINLIVETK